MGSPTQPPEKVPPQTPEQLVYHTVHWIINEASKGSGLTTFGAIGALEAVKADLLDELSKWNTSHPEG